MLNRNPPRSTTRCAAVLIAFERLMRQKPNHALQHMFTKLYLMLCSTHVRSCIAMRR